MKGRGKIIESKSLVARHIALLLLVTGLGVAYTSPANAQASCNRNLTADVVALDMPLMFNRLGAQNINGMMYALRGDVVDKSSLLPIGGGGTAGNVTLRPDKRPRPLVLRMGAGDCMAITVSASTVKSMTRSLPGTSVSASRAPSLGTTVWMTVLLSVRIQKAWYLRVKRRFLRFMRRKMALSSA